VAGITGRRFRRPVPIDPDHDTSAFACGHDALDDWLKTEALKAEGRSARTYVVCEKRAVVGYYCLATGSVSRTAVAKKPARKATELIPAMIISRLAVAESCRGRGLGRGMLRDAFRRVLQAAEVVGCKAVLVRAVDDAAVAFYAGYGFAEFPGGGRRLFLPLETIRRAL
jgi:ribosomal protein S18 acetylase RimI-like enzyme